MLYKQGVQSYYYSSSSNIDKKYHVVRIYVRRPSLFLVFGPSRVTRIGVAYRGWRGEGEREGMRGGGGGDAYYVAKYLKNASRSAFDGSY